MARWVELEDTCPRCRFVIFRRMRLNGEEEAKPESCASDCSADGRRVKQGEASVQPAGPEQLLEKLKAFIERELKEWDVSAARGGDRVRRSLHRQITSEYEEMLRMIESEAGGGHPDLHRPAG